jgi:hypothetical protein
MQIFRATLAYTGVTTRRIRLAGMLLGVGCCSRIWANLCSGGVSNNMLFRGFEAPRNREFRDLGGLLPGPLVHSHQDSRRLARGLPRSWDTTQR